MSYSFRKTPIIGCCGGKSRISEKKDKRIANKSLRRINKMILKEYDENTIFKEMREISDIWSWNKDGKMIFDPFIDDDWSWRLMIK